VPCRKIGVVDTVGAGDSFHSALLAGLNEQAISPAIAWRNSMSAC